MSKASSVIGCGAAAQRATLFRDSCCRLFCETRASCLPDRCGATWTKAEGPRLGAGSTKNPRPAADGHTERVACMVDIVTRRAYELAPELQGLRQLFPDYRQNGVSNKDCLAQMAGHNTVDTCQRSRAQSPKKLGMQLITLDPAKKLSKGHDQASNEYNTSLQRPRRPGSYSCKHLQLWSNMIPTGGKRELKDEPELPGLGWSTRFDLISEPCQDLPRTSRSQLRSCPIPHL